MRCLYTIICLTISINALDPGSNWSDRLREKVKSAVVGTYTVENFSLAHVSIDNNRVEVNRNWRDHFFKVESDGILKGYIYVDQASSMKDIFDYIVLFDPELSIANSKVLIYREQHGRQIGSKRWLSQFTGMTPDDRPELNKDIDGISGATISVKSMTKAVRELLEDLDRVIIES